MESQSTSNRTVKLPLPYQIITIKLIQMQDTNADMHDNYQRNLRHMAQPATPDERREAVSATLSDYEALYLASMLREWASYHAESDTDASIAQGYVEHINQQVRDRRQADVTLYAHTKDAAEVLCTATVEWYHHYSGTDEINEGLVDAIDEATGEIIGRHDAETIAEVSGRCYDPAPSDVTIDSE